MRTINHEEMEHVVGGTPPCWAPAHGYQNKNECKDEKDKCEKEKDECEKEDPCKIVDPCKIY